MPDTLNTSSHRISAILCGLFILLGSISGQNSFTEALDKYRTYGEKNSLEWAELRRPSVNPQSLKDSIAACITQNKCGYIAYPAHLGNAFEFIENPDAQKAIQRVGYLQTPPSALPDKVEQCSYIPWLFGNELLTETKNKANNESLKRFFAAANGQIKVTRALWYYFNPKEPEKKLPLPTADNMYFFTGKSGDLDRIHQLLGTRKQGYIICPVWTEDITGVLDSPDENPTVKGSGTIEFLVTETPLSIALNLTLWEEESAELKQTDVIPFVYDTTYTQIVKNWMLSVKELYPETIRSFYCYFDNRTPEDILKDQIGGHCAIPVFQQDGLTSETDTLITRIAKQPRSGYPIAPYWMEDVYEKIPDEMARKIIRMQYLGYVADSTNGMPTQVSNWQKKPCLMDIPPFQDTLFDLMVLFRGEQATNQFLTSQEAQLALITGLLEKDNGLLIRDPSLRKANGLNLYFPDYDFRLGHRRDLVQFVKSISFVIDSFCVEGNKIYTDYDLTVTFPIPAKKHIGFLSILLKYKLVDRICFINYDAMGVPVSSCVDPQNPNGPVLNRVIYEGEYDSSLMDNLFNSLFYLLNPFPFNEEASVCSDNLEKLTQSEYADPMLIYFIVAFMALLILLIGLIIAYLSNSKFYIFVQHKQRYIVPVLLTLISEILLVLYLITNIVSSRETYDIWTQLFILALPFFFFILAASPFRHHEKEPLP